MSQGKKYFVVELLCVLGVCFRLRKLNFRVLRLRVLGLRGCCPCFRACGSGLSTVSHTRFEHAHRTALRAWQHTRLQSQWLYATSHFNRELERLAENPSNTTAQSNCSAQQSRSKEALMPLLSVLFLQLLLRTTHIT